MILQPIITCFSHFYWSQTYIRPERWAACTRLLNDYGEYVCAGSDGGCASSSSIRWGTLGEGTISFSESSRGLAPTAGEYVVAWVEIEISNTQAITCCLQLCKETPHLRHWTLVHDTYSGPGVVKIPVQLPFGEVVQKLLLLSLRPHLCMSQ